MHTVFWLVLIMTGSLATNAQGFLRTDGKKIINDNGEVILRGMGLGGWMLQEPYMLQLSEVAGTQHEIKEKIEDLVGVSNTQVFYDAWLANHCRKADVDSMAAWGFNSIRLPMHYNLFTLPVEEEPVAGQQTWLDKGFVLTDSLLEWCKANQLYLILDLHAAPGGQGKDAAISDYDNTKPSLWESDANKQKTIALWKKLAERYVNETWIGGYDLINETNWGFQNLANDPNGCAETGNAPLKQLLADITTAIRQVDNNHIIYIEGNCWANNHNGLLPLWDNNMVLSFHKYWNYNDQNSIQGMIGKRDQYNIPLWMGEGGENSNTWNRKAIELLESNHIGWAWWPLKKLGLNCPLEIRVNPGYQSIVNYWKGSGGKPSATDAMNALMQLTENIKTENAVYHKDVIDAMFRQVTETETLPFTKLEAPGRVYAVDYDMGRNRYAYYDTDTADYHVATGTYTAWNQGWSYRNDGVDIEVCTDAVTNGYNVGWINAGEWMQYTVTVKQAGYYKIGYRVASENVTCRFKLELNNKGTITELETVTFPATGGWKNWKTVEGANIYLEQGIQTIRFLSLTGSFNLNWLQFHFLTATAVNDPANPGSAIIVYPNPVNDVIHIKFTDPLILARQADLLDITGKRISHWSSSSGMQQINLHNILPGVYILSLLTNRQPVNKKIFIQ